MNTALKVFIATLLGMGGLGAISAGHANGTEEPAKTPLILVTDPQCVTCRSQFIELMNAEQLVFEPKLVAYTPEGESQAIAVICSDQPKSALSRLFLGQGATPKTAADDACRQAATKQLKDSRAWLQAHGVLGTPVLIAPDGRYHVGYMSVEALMSWLSMS